MGDAGGVPAGAAVAGPGARGVGARVSRREAAVVGARQLRAPPRRDRPPGRRDRAALPRRVGAGDEPGGTRARRRADRRGAVARRPGRRRGRRRAHGGRTRCGCSRIGRAQRRTTSRSPTATSAPSGCCAAASTGSRSRSSSPRRGCGRCHPRISSPVSTSGSSSSRAAAAPRSSGIRRCGARSTGPTTCSTRPSVMRSTGCRCSPAAVIWPRPKPCWPTTTSTRSDVVDVLGQLVDKSLVVADDDGRRGALPAARDHPPVRAGATRRERRHGGGPTPPRRPLRRAGRSGRSAPAGPRPARVDATSSRATSTTSAPRSTGPSRHPRPTTRSAWSRRSRCAAGSANSRWTGPRPRSRSPAATITRSFPWSPPGPRGAQRWAAISSGPKTSSPPRNEPKPRSVSGLRPWRGLRRLLAFYRSDFEEARRHAEEWVELARASGDPYELAHALIMLGSALQITEPTLDAAIAAVDEAVRVARAAGIDAALSIGLRPRRDLAPVRGVRTRARAARRSHRDRYPHR